jgi:Ni/Co efflux regulator RcnB
MKTFALIAAAVLALPLAATAQTTAPATGSAPAKAPAKPVAKDRAPTATKRVVQKVVPKKIIKKVEEAQDISPETDVTLTEAEIKESERVYTGVIKCELGASVDVEADPKKPGFFTLVHNGVKYRLHPVESKTGALRLEDPRMGAMWLQLGNKSMLMSQKQGLRLADDCQAAKQIEVAADMKVHPPANLFDGADAPRK